MSHSFFVHSQHRHRITTIYPASTFQVQIEDAPTMGLGLSAGVAGHSRTQTFSISVEQLTSNDLLVCL